MALIPDNASDSMVNSLWELAVRITEEHAKALRDDPTLAERIDAGGLEAASQEADKLLKRVIDLRGRNLDVRYEYVGKACGGWSCWNENSYDGAPDSESNHIGYGPEKENALVDLLDKLDAS